MRIFNYNQTVLDYFTWVNRDQEGGVASLMNVYLDLDTCEVGGIPQGLKSSSVWLASKGVVQIAQGDSAGWSALKAAASFRYWAGRMYLLFYDRATAKRRQPTEKAYRMGLNYLSLLTLGEFAVAEWLGERLDGGRSGGSVSAWNWGHLTPHLAIALQRYLRTGAQADLSDLELGVYGSVFQAWNTPDRLKPALLAAADYHVQNLDVEPYDNDDVLEFSSAPYDIFPVEIHAIYQARKHLGLSTPQIHHPLVNTPFGRVPEEIPEVNDPLLDRAVERVREILPGL